MEVIKGLCLFAYVGMLWLASMTVTAIAFFALLYIVGTAIALVFGTL